MNSDFHKQGRYKSKGRLKLNFRFQTTFFHIDTLRKAKRRRDLINSR